jgi:hypothetical protein
MFTPSFTPRDKHALLFRRMEGQTENFTPRRQTSSLRAKFTPRGEVKNGPQESKLGRETPCRIMAWSWTSAARLFCARNCLITEVRF